MRSSNALRSASVHQLMQVSRAVVFAALVVEAVADFVADHGADAAIVHRIVGIRIEERRLQDRGRKENRVRRISVVGVHGRRRHDSTRCGRPADRCGRAGSAIRKASLRETSPIRSSRRIGQVRIVAPLVGIADMRREGMQLVERLLPRLAGHPGNRADIRVIRLQTDWRRVVRPWPSIRAGKYFAT